MGTEIWGIILLIAYLAIFVCADIFLVKFIKKGTALSMKKSYIYSVLSFFIVMMMLFFSATLSLTILVEFENATSLPFVIQMLTISLCSIPFVQLIFMIGAYIKYTSSVLYKRWRNVFLSLGLSMVLFVMFCSIFTSI